ncbi:MAG: hypothetical protein E6H49_09090 [Betaproteobacteria bacterium]|nr:MAG: hypothetical protein E6H49_09090 [Betaproteobacteria bacterium]
MLPVTSVAPNRTLRHLLLAAALVFTQQAAQLHALSHVQHDMAKAERSGKCVPPVSHPAEQCIAFHAVDSALPALALAIEPPRIVLPALAPVVLPLPFSPRIVFDSRAPPILS